MKLYLSNYIYQERYQEILIIKKNLNTLKISLPEQDTAS